MGKIPEEAKKVFDGIIFDVYQWQQKQFDGSYLLFEMLQRVYSVNVIPITNEGKVVLTKQEQPSVGSFIGSIGGRIDPGEGPLDAGKRELLEEAGLEGKDWKLWYSTNPSSKIDWEIYTYIVKGITKVAEATPDSGEKIELIEFTFDEYLQLAVDPNFRDHEIAFKLLKAEKDPVKLNELKKLFSVDE